MNLDEKDLKPCVTELVGFNAAASPSKGYIDLKLTLGTKDSFRAGRVRFVVVDTSSSYNVIIGRPTIHEWDMLISTKHQALKKPNMNNEIVTIRGDQEESRKCYYETLRVHHGGPSSPPRLKEGGTKDQSLKACRREVNLVELDVREELLENRDVFAWKASEIPGIDPTFCCHKLSMYPGSRPVSQKKRKIGSDRRHALNEHVDELLAAGFVSEIQYTTWLSNVVMVKKPSGKWRICVDYTDLNKVCPKDSYPMSSIDQLVDNSSGFQLLSFMDAYSGYNQIPLHPDDHEKNAFMTEKGNFCYNVMPFGLKNAGATY
ncbi:uncharacterized protein LOC133285354 [Gastrolobium bilobum]|uniref:uncharacterized protein LOC133285354 n=1 Tax=Gastrolobium bilobum TaxID=150636 RepID=UPI002AB29174|nr:uncharacterized protein LOC133285354 [Gastrolobium bilobum]